MIAQEIATGDYDIIALQEVNQTIAAQTIVPDGLYCPTRWWKSRRTILLYA